MFKKGQQLLVWRPTVISAFQELKERFTSAPIPHHSDPELEFIVEVDASSTDIGAVLSQRQGNPLKVYPCAFYSRKLNPAEQNYDVGNRELLAMKAAFEEWRHLLEGAKHPFTVLTNHHNFEYLWHTAQVHWTPKLMLCLGNTNHPYYHPPRNPSSLQPWFSPPSNGISWLRSQKLRPPTRLWLKLLLTSHTVLSVNEYTPFEKLNF